MRDFRNEREAQLGNDWRARQGRGHDVYQEDISAKTLIQALASIVFGSVAAISLFYWIAQ